MFKLQELVRKNIQKLKPYSSARDEFSGQANVYLDANENSIGSVVLPTFNRYPDPHQQKLKQAIAAEWKVEAEKIFLGNGSDECIDLLYRCFCEPGKDNVITCPPTYGMYEVSANIHDVAVKKGLLTADFQLNVREIKQAIDAQTKLLWLCSPNNPTGNLLKQDAIIELLQTFNRLVIVDEAYIDFADAASFTQRLDEFPNLVVLQTFSKAWGMAGLRLGLCFASAGIIQLLNKLKPPYNINQYTQDYALKAIAASANKKEMVKQLLSYRQHLEQQLKEVDGVERIYPSDANFLLVKMENARQRYGELVEKGIVVRDRSNVQLCEDCLRITVGTPVQNELLIAALNGQDGRAAVRQRTTNETAVKIEISLEGAGRCFVNTGVKFFDHMLEQIARHGQVDLFITANGDLEVDEHHTIEDTAIALGEAVAKALGDKRGIERYGFALPMDEAEAKVLIDFGGRNWLIWNADFNREKIGEVPTEMFYHFFKSFSDAAKCNLNIECRGENEHHKIEAIFKAFAKAIKMAVRKDPLSDYLPTTKGIL